MTTVCYDGKELVTDSQVTLGDMAHPSPFTKIFTPNEGEWWEVHGVKAIAFGLAGDADAGDYVRDKLREGISHRTRFETEDLVFGAVVIDENGRCYEWRAIVNQKHGRATHTLVPMIPPVAIGSGQPYAMAAMTIGKDAKAAVKAAIRLDVYSGGELQIWAFPGKPETPSVRPVKEEPVKAVAQAATQSNEPAPVAA